MSESVSSRLPSVLTSAERVLIASPICPFCQRIQILLIDSGLPHQRYEVDFTRMPDWLASLTPERKVPVLLIRGVSIFDSRAILEHINDASAGRYLPADPLDRAVARSWCSHWERTHDEIRRYFTASDRETLLDAQQRIRQRLALLFERCSADLLSPERLSLVGVHAAVALLLLDTLECGPHRFVDEGSPLDHWKTALLRHPSVAAVGGSAYQKRLLRFLCARPTAFAAEPLVQQKLQRIPAHDTERDAAAYLSR